MTYKAEWCKILSKSIGSEPCVIIEGNVNDLFVENGTLLTLSAIIKEIAGCDSYIAANVSDGFACSDNDDVEKAIGIAEMIFNGGSMSVSEIRNNRKKAMLDMNYGGTPFVSTSEIIREILMRDPADVFGECANISCVQLSMADMLNDTESTSVQPSFLNMREGIYKAFVNSDDEGHEKVNTLVLVVENISSLPGWFTSVAKTITISNPDSSMRKAFWSLAYNEGFSEEEMEKLISASEGMTVREMLAFKRYSDASYTENCSITDALDGYRYGVPINKWKEAAENVDFDIEKSLLNKVKGQDKQIKRIADKMNYVLKGRGSIQSTARHKPKACFFLAGPTGTGKTETARTIAETIFGSKEALITINLAEYRDRSTINNLIGSPKGYIGSETGGMLTNAVKAHPFSVVLFDEAEKADSEIFKVLMSILDEGKVTDGKGITVDFSQTVIIFTSNIGIKDAILDLPTADMTDEMAKKNYEALEKCIINAIYKEFAPEFIGRLGGLNDPLIYNYIYGNNAMEIITDKLNALVDDYKRDGYNISFESDVADRLYKEYHLPENLEYGGRQIVNLVDRLSVRISKMLDELYVKEPDKRDVVISCSIFEK